MRVRRRRLHPPARVVRAAQPRRRLRPLRLPRCVHRRDPRQLLDRSPDRSEPFSRNEDVRQEDPGAWFLPSWILPADVLGNSCCGARELLLACSAAEGDGPADRGAGPAAVAGHVVGEAEPQPRPPVVGVLLRRLRVRREGGVRGRPLDAPARPAGQPVAGQGLLRPEPTGEAGRLQRRTAARGRAGTPRSGAARAAPPRSRSRPARPDRRNATALVTTTTRYSTSTSAIVTAPPKALTRTAATRGRP